MYLLTEAFNGYYEFLKKEYADENILFVAEVEEYKKLQSKKSRRTKADEICAKYILEDSPKEVCIVCTTSKFRRHMFTKYVI